MMTDGKVIPTELLDGLLREQRDAWRRLKTAIAGGDALVAARERKRVLTLHRAITLHLVGTAPIDADTTDADVRVTA